MEGEGQVTGVRIETLMAGFRRWVEQMPELPASLDLETARFCRRRLRAYADADVLSAKLESELFRTGFSWRPLGRVLVIASERDVLGTICALLALCATGNRCRIKAREMRPVLEDLRQCLGLSTEDAEILTWDSGEQDDAAVLDGIDAVLVAAGDAAIRHYRAVTPPDVRLIEFGPRVSFAAIAADALAHVSISGLAERLLRDVTLFRQGVCSSPVQVLVHPSIAEPLHREVVRQCSSLRPLDHHAALLQRARAEELRCLERLGWRISVTLDPDTLWGVASTPELDARLRIVRGPTLVAGTPGRMLAEVAALHRGRLQTLGVAGAVDPAAAADLGFTRVCPLGTMHEREPWEPHDGIFELPALVDFVAS